MRQQIFEDALKEIVAKIEMRRKVGGHAMTTLREIEKIAQEALKRDD